MAVGSGPRCQFTKKLLNQAALLSLSDFLLRQGTSFGSSPEPFMFYSPIDWQSWQRDLLLFGWRSCLQPALILNRKVPTHIDECSGIDNRNLELLGIGSQHDGKKSWIEALKSTDMRTMLPCVLDTNSVGAIGTDVLKLHRKTLKDSLMRDFPGDG